MLQDLWIPVDNVVPGDHIVLEGAFYKVIESEMIGHSMWRITYIDPEKPQSEELVERHWILVDIGVFPPVRVRPCAPSGKCEET